MSAVEQDTESIVKRSILKGENDVSVSEYIWLHKTIELVHGSPSTIGEIGQYRILIARLTNILLISIYLSNVCCFHKSIIFEKKKS